LVSQVITQIQDIGIDANDRLNELLDKLCTIPQLFAGLLSETDLQLSYRECRRLSQLRGLFRMGLREIGDAVVLYETVSDLSYEELERIIEARFEKTQLRDSILRTI
jgi:hypothetical protein